MNQEKEDLEKTEFRERIVQELMQKHSFITTRETNELYVYVDGVYELGIAETIIADYSEQILKKECTRYEVNEIVDHIKRRTYVDWDFFAVPLNLICLANGVLNIETLELEPHSPDYHFLNKIPVHYIPKEEWFKFQCEDRTDKFMHELIENQQDIDAIHEFFGYCLYRRIPIHKTLMLVGDGANGKSTLLKLLIAFLGVKNVSNLTLQEICYNRFSAVELYGKLANIYADLGDQSILTLGRFKIVTGEDMFEGEKKFQQKRRQFVSYAKHFYSCNKMPSIEDDTSANWRRWYPIELHKVFNKELGNVDENILEKLTTKEELSGLLLKVLDGLKRLLQNHDFSNAKTTLENRQFMIMKSDPIKYFAEECLEEDSEVFEQKTVVYEAYREFCKKNKLEIKEMMVFSRRLRIDITFRDCQKNIEGKPKVWCYGGIRLKTRPETQQTPLLPNPSDVELKENQQKLNLIPNNSEKVHEDLKDSKSEDSICG